MIYALNALQVHQWLSNVAVVLAGGVHDYWTCPGERTITALNEKYWERRLSGESIWLVEFYAPWCSACQRFSKGYKEVAKLLEEDEIETGAVNCQTEANLCAERFAIRSYPTIRLINRERGTQQEYVSMPSACSPAVACGRAALVLRTPRYICAFADWGWSTMQVPQL
jgi:thiol-disulfide isomerase/thioredoxin